MVQKENDREITNYRIKSLLIESMEKHSDDPRSQFEFGFYILTDCIITLVEAAIPEKKQRIDLLSYFFTHAIDAIRENNE